MKVNDYLLCLTMANHTYLQSKIDFINFAEFLILHEQMVISMKKVYLTLELLVTDAISKLLDSVTNVYNAPIMICVVVVSQRKSIPDIT